MPNLISAKLLFEAIVHTLRSFKCDCFSNIYLVVKTVLQTQASDLHIRTDARMYGGTFRRTSSMLNASHSVGA